MLKSYSKINFSLRVMKKMINGLHDVQSKFFLIYLHDDIKIQKIKSKRDIVLFKGIFNKKINKRLNTVIKTLKVLREKKLIIDNYKITINKKIPSFSGLGGGTGNAASIIKFFLKKKVIEKNIVIFEKKIGSDLRLFFYKQGFQKNLRNIIKYKKKYKFYTTIVFPKLNCSTKEIYSKVKKYGLPSKVNFSRIKDRSQSNFIKLLKYEKNDLQDIVVKKHPIIGKIITFTALQKGCLFSRLTGSGSACFGIFNSYKLAKEASKKIKRKYPQLWCIATKTI